MAQVKYNGTNVYRAQGVTLLPGINEVDADKLDDFLAHPGVKHRVNAKVVEVVKSGDTSSTSARKPSADEVVATVKEMFNVEELEALKANDKRKPVQEAIDAQIALIKDAG